MRKALHCGLFQCTLGSVKLLLQPDVFSVGVTPPLDHGLHVLPCEGEGEGGGGGGEMDWEGV